jgi:hypothetical protein
MIDLHFGVAFFHKAKWIEFTNTREINHVLGENTIGYSTVGKYVRMLPYQRKKQTLLYSPNQRVTSVLTTASRLCSLRSHFVQSAKFPRRLWCRNQQRIAIWRRLWDRNCGISSGSLAIRLSLKKKNRVQRATNFWSFYSQSDTKMALYCHP